MFIGRAFTWDIPFHPPLSLGYLAACVKKAGHDVQTIDAMAENLGMHELERRIARFFPDVIGISTNIATGNKGTITARYLKRLHPDIPVIFGGPWATVEFKQLLVAGVADAVVIGEGEESLVELLDYFHDKTSWAGIKGIAFASPATGEIMRTPARPFNENLDSLPFPAWELLPDSRKYQFYARGYPLYPVMTSRGCPYDCIHCTKLVHGYKYRPRSPENVLREIEHLKERFHVKTIAIVDDNFTQDMARAERILDLIIEKRLGINFLFSNGIRADTITPRFAVKLKAAGFYYIGIGIESGDQAIVNQIGKRLDLAKVKQAVHLIQKHDMISCGYFILGHPQDTPRSMYQTIEFARQLKLDYTQFFKAVPFPGTKMHDMIAKDGKFIQANANGARDIDGYNIASASFEIGDLKAEDVEKAFKHSYRRFYLSPVKLAKLASQMRSLSEAKWFVKSIVQIFLKNLIS
nr:radical SAM protein [Candidatus Sigynarchaeota archaeon]